MTECKNDKIIKRQKDRIIKKVLPKYGVIN